MPNDISLTSQATTGLRFQPYNPAWKRAFDMCFAIALLPLLGPVIALLWVLTKLQGGSGFFGHKRVGQNGKIFKCWKIRTMVPDAEARLAKYLSDNPNAQAEWDRDFKLTNDPRITRFGNFLRRTSLDELPQLWNVIKGEMSFVGPRPIIESELHKYAEYKHAYLTLKPGVTGVWQVSGRNDVTYEERVAMDVGYHNTIGFWFDLQIIAKTAKAVLSRTGK